jgi:thiamine biosynthesis lipoprotein
MACRFEITLSSDHAPWVPAARTALNEIDGLENELSVFRDGSAISRINRSAASEGVAIDASLFELLRYCGEIHRDTDGAFDITSTPLSRCWGFLQREGRLPSSDAIADARARVGFGAIELDSDRRTIRFARHGIELNLGAIGKGYALDRVAVGLRASGVADALLSAGRSSLLAVGGTGPGWHIDVVSPRADRPLASVWLRDAALGTSGAGEQFVEVDGTRYGHVIDPRTGWPASGVLSASVIASSAAAADALSTAFLIGGVELADRYCSEHPDVLALVTLDDGSVTPRLFGQHPGACGPRALRSACGPSEARSRRARASGGGALRALRT